MFLVFHIEQNDMDKIYQENAWSGHSYEYDKGINGLEKLGDFENQR